MSSGPFHMRCLVTITVLLAATAAPLVSALEIGPAEFRAAKQLVCVLAQESLGYLGQAEYDEMADTVLEAFDEVERDTIYAKALGYYDGLMFAIPEYDESQVNQRLELFVSSDKCTSTRGARFTNSPLPDA